MEFVAEGSRIVQDLVRAAPEQLQFICATPEWYEKRVSSLVLNDDKVRIISESILQSVSSLSSTEEVIAVFSFPEFTLAPGDSNRLIIYLEKIRDPGNLGTIIRSADWFGIPEIYCSMDCVDPFNNKCVQATMSSIMRVNVKMKHWEEMINDFPSVDKFAATKDGFSMYQLEKKSVGFVCIGNESNGLSPDILNSCNKTLSIPSGYSMGAESLNAAIACSLIMAWKTF